MGIALGGGVGYIAGKIVEENGQSSSIEGQHSTSSSGDQTTFTIVGVAVGGTVGYVLGSSAGKVTYDVGSMNRAEQLAFLRKEIGGPAAGRGGERIVRLRNGSRIKGTVVEMIPDSILTLRTADSSLFIVRMSEVESVTADTVAVSPPASP